MSDLHGPSARAKRTALRLLARSATCVPHWWLHPCRPEKWREVLVYQGGGLGDLLRIFPVLEVLRETRPTARITLLAELAAPFETLFPSPDLVDAVVRMDLTSAEASPWRKLRLALRLRRQRFDAVIAGNRGIGMLENALFCAAVGGRDRIGFTAAGAGFPFTTPVPFRSDRPIAAQNLDLLRAAGLRVADRVPQVRVSSTDREWARGLLGSKGGPLIAVHPFAQCEARFRVWPAERYAALVTALVTRLRARVLLLGGPTDRLARRVSPGLHPGDVVDIVGITSLGQTAALLEAADLFVGNDSGLLHLALAVRRPAVGIFGSTAPEQVVGSDADCTAVRIPIALPCQPCYRHQPFFEIKCDHVNCLRTLSVEAVLAAVEHRLNLLATPTLRKTSEGRVYAKVACSATPRDLKGL